MKYGHFSADYKYYAITNPRTPRSWDNHISNDEYGLRINQVGQGASFLPVPDGNKVTHEGDEPGQGRFFYIRDNETYRYWSSVIEPVGAEYSEYTCRHGIGWTEIVTETEKIRSIQTTFVPLKGPCELWLCSVQNNDTKARKLSVFPFMEFQLTAYTSPWDNYLWYTQADYSKDEKMIICTLQNARIPGRNYQGFMAVDYEHDGCDIRLADFLGGGGLKAPDNVRTNTSAQMRCVSSDRAGGVFRKEIELKPGEEFNFTVMVGLENDPKIRKELRRGYLSCDKAEKELIAVKNHWDTALDSVTVETPDEKFNAMTNIWAKYNAYMLTRSLRTNYKGYRDALQDAMAMAIIDPPRAKAIMQMLFQYQFADGSAVRQMSISAGPDDIRRYYDSPAWMVLALSRYLKETGDADFLDESISFYTCSSDGMRLEPEEQGTVYEHVKRGMEWILSKRGHHNLICIGNGDWNDALDQVGSDDKGVSIWLSELVHYCLTEMAAICRIYDDSKTAESYLKQADELKKILNEKAWDGEWFIRAIHDNGRIIGSRTEKEGRIFLTAQACAVLWDAADDEHAQKALASVERELDTEYGPLLLTPPYLSYDSDVGRLTILPPGFGENNNIYTHSGLFTVAAYLHMGKADKAYELYRKLTPIYELHNADITSMPPYAYVNCFGGPHYPEKFGTTQYSWYSSSANWACMIGVEYFCGLYGEHDGLRIDPCLPKGFDSVTAVRTYRGDKYFIEIRNPDGITGKGNVSLMVDGEKISGNTIPPFSDGKEHTVVVTLAHKKSPAAVCAD